MTEPNKIQWHENFLKMSGGASLIILIATAWLVCIFVFIDQFQQLQAMQIIVMILVLSSLTVFLLQIAISFKQTYYNSLKASATSKFQKISLISGIFSIIMITVLMSLFSFKSILKDYKNPYNTQQSHIHN